MTDSQTASTSASVTTDRPARYGKQLVSHLGRRSGGEWSDDTGSGWIRLGEAHAEVEAAGRNLLLRVRCEPADLAKFEDVVGRHLVRFGARDELVVQWTRQNGGPGTEQRRED